MKSLWVRRTASELLGTALLVGIGTGAIVGTHGIPGFPLAGLAVAWFLAVLIPMLLFIRRSGAHLNPVITVALAASGRIAWREAPVYILGQLAGAFSGSGVVLGYFGELDRLGSTVPAQGEILRAFPAEFGFTAALVASVFFLADRGEGPGRWRMLLPPSVVAAATFLIGPWTGSSLNPARTLAPAVLSGTYTDIWVYMTAIPLGALLVAVVWRPHSVDRLDRGPGRVQTSR